MARQRVETKAKFAARMGVSRARVTQWVADGLPLTRDSRIKVDAALAWLKDRVPQPGRYADRGIHRLAGAASTPKPSTKAAAPTTKHAMPAMNNDAAVGNVSDLYLRARAAKMASDAKRADSEAKRARLELRARMDELVEVAEVSAAAYNAARVTRVAILNVPGRIAAVLATETDPKKIHDALTDELNLALATLSEGDDLGVVGDGQP